MTALQQHIADPDVLALLRQILDAGGMRVGRLWWQRSCGLVQGSSLSPLLCNLALHPLDLAVAKVGHDTQGGVACLRYADDLLLLASDAKLSRKAFDTVQQTLRKLYQTLRNTNVASIPASDGIPWLGVQLAPRPLAFNGQISFGYSVPNDKVQAMLERLTEMTSLPSERIAVDAFNVARWIVSVNDQLRDWCQAYRFADNASGVFRVLDAHTRNRVADLIRSLTSANMSDLYRQYRVRLPRGFWTWQVPGARLSVLSALAPHAPTYLTRRPAWMCRLKADGPSAQGVATSTHAIPVPVKEILDA